MKLSLTCFRLKDAVPVGYDLANDITIFILLQLFLILT